MAATGFHEESLSDASLVEDEEDADMAQDQMNSSTSEIIDLPGEPLTAPIDTEDATDSYADDMAGADSGNVVAEDPLDSELSGARFHGFAPEIHYLAEEKSKVWKSFIKHDVDLSDPDLSEITDGQISDLGVDHVETSDMGVDHGQTSDMVVDNGQMSDMGVEQVTSVGLPPPPPPPLTSTLEAAPMDTATPQAKLTTPKKPTPGPATKKPAVAPAEPMRRESREWAPKALLFKPLSAGWVREVIYKQGEDGKLLTSLPPDIAYHSPSTPGHKSKCFRSIAELSTYLSTDSVFSWPHFSYRKEVLGANAPPGQEVIRGENQKVDIVAEAKPPPSPQPQPQPVSAKSKHVNTEMSTPEATSDLKPKPFGKTKSHLDSEPQQGVVPRVTASLTKIGPHAFGSPQFSASSSIHGPSGWGLPKPQRLSAPPPSAKTKSVLRPGNSSVDVFCSTHCPGVSHYLPSLSCLQCQSVFHPTCVGLVEGVDYEALYNFYCNNCDPPHHHAEEEMDASSPRHFLLQSHQHDKENSSPFFARRGRGSRGARRSLDSRSPAVSPFASHQSHLSRNADSGAKHLVKRGSGRGRASNAARGHAHVATPRPRAPAPSPPPSLPPAPAREEPSAPIETQAVINIAGIDYVVWPRNDAPAPKRAKMDGEDTRLPLLLRPAGGRNAGLPVFEVEETREGKLLLLPVGGQAFSNPFKVRSAAETKSSTTAIQSGSFGQHFATNLSGAYYALIKVFGYLGLHDRLRAAQVCRMWHELTYHSSLWQKVNLKDVSVASWPGFADFLLRSRASQLDMRTMLFPLSPEDTWREMLEEVGHLPTTVARMELPRISAPMLTRLLAACPALKSVTAVAFPGEFDLCAVHASAANLEELRLKATTNARLTLANSLMAMPNNLSRLTTLSLLNLERVTQTDLDAIATFPKVERLELGDCSSAPSTLFKTIKTLQKLTSLRLEKCVVGNNLCDIRWLSKLERLELIDVQLKEGFGDGLVRLETLRKLLLIPDYKDEVAPINAEIVDSAQSMTKLTHYYLGLTNEWLEVMSSLLCDGGGVAASAPARHKKGSFPILVQGKVEMFSLTKLRKTLGSALPASRVKVLEMSRSATVKQFLDNLG